VSDDDYQSAQELTRAGMRAVEQLYESIDIILTPAAPGEAPEGLGATGDPVFNRIWTLLQLPCVTLPFGKGLKALPLSVQLVGPHKGDEKLLQSCHWMESILRNF
jgi:amidase